MIEGPIAVTGLGAIADRFDHVLLDQWGTLHEGRTIAPAAIDCVTKLREAGKRVLALSNSGKRADANQRRLAGRGDVERFAHAGARTVQKPRPGLLSDHARQ
jgi:ribonucleotide monophosphatase NagD (HAD superfamily)